VPRVRPRTTNPPPPRAIWLESAGQAGAPAALQLYSRELYRWRQVAHTRVDRHSRASFVVSPPGRYAARVVLLKGRGGYGASVGPVRHIGPPRSGSRRHRMPAQHMPHMHH
jgi:hypothetical protein